jgi:hypothetical protein
MRALKKLLAIAALGGALGACYVSTHPPTYVAVRTCQPGFYWNGYRCVYHNLY